MLVVAEQIWWFENLRICLMFQVQFACPFEEVWRWFEKRRSSSGWQNKDLQQWTNDFETLKSLNGSLATV